jgi:hypothetical protein
MLLAHPTTSDWKRSDPIVFQRVDENGLLIEPQSNGFMVRFTVERSSCEGADFETYLRNGNLCIDVWNADSLMHFGCAVVPLKVKMSLSQSVRISNHIKSFRIYLHR